MLVGWLYSFKNPLPQYFFSNLFLSRCVVTLNMHFWIFSSKVLNCYWDILVGMIRFLSHLLWIKLTADVLLWLSCVSVCSTSAKYECNGVGFQYIFMNKHKSVDVWMTVVHDVIHKLLVFTVMIKCLYINKHECYLEAHFFRLQTYTDTDLVWIALIWDITEARAVQHNQEGSMSPSKSLSARCRFIRFTENTHYIYNIFSKSVYFYV